MIFRKLQENSKSKQLIKKFSEIIKWLKGNSNLDEIEDIWENKEELKKSNLDKISFENLLIKLEENIKYLNEINEISVLEDEELKEIITCYKNYSSISQRFIFVDENEFVVEIIQKILQIYRFKGNNFFREKKEFLLNIFSQFDFIIPIKRLKFRMEGFF
jgi:glutaredoxin-related protein